MRWGAASRTGDLHRHALNTCGFTEAGWEMKFAEIAEALGLATVAAGSADADVCRGYASDLMSDVLARAPRGAVLATIQTHMNVVAVAAHARLAGIIFTGNRRPDPEVVARAAQEGIALYCTPADTFEVAGRMYALGLRGKPL